MRDGFIKTAAVTPDIRVADCEYNAEQICKNPKKNACFYNKKCDRFSNYFAFGWGVPPGVMK